MVTALGRLARSLRVMTVVLLTLLLATLLGVRVSTASGPHAVGHVFAKTLYVDPQSRAAHAARAEVDIRRRAALEKVAKQPTAMWLGDWVRTEDVRAHVARRVASAQREHATSLFVLYAVPGRDCGSYSGGGLQDSRAYLRWVEQVALGLSEHGTSAVILEPDALAQLDCLNATQTRERLVMLRDAITRLTAVAGVAVYVDAGHAHWNPVHVMAERLRAVGVDRARGFSLNVANFGQTSDQVRYGLLLGRTVGRETPFLVDTSRNGLGRSNGPLAWCNPAGRALGSPPQSPVPHPLVDALVWVKYPGNSDGSCRKGEPTAGTFWPEYAIGLATRAKW